MIDIIIPSCKNIDDCKEQIENIKKTRKSKGQLIFTGLKDSAAKNRNFGLKKARSKIIIMVDDDIRGFFDGWDETLCELLIEYPRYKFISPELTAPDGGHTPMQGRIIKSSSKILYTATENIIPLACVIFRRDKKIFFDEEYVGSGFEDTDFLKQYEEKYHMWNGITNKVKLIHLNEAKNQRGHNNEIWKKNYNHFCNKWDKEQKITNIVKL